MNSLLQFLNENTAVSAFGLSLLHSLWQGAGIALLLWLSLKVWPQAGAKTRYTLALLASSALVASFAFTFSYQLSTAAPVHAQHQAEAFQFVVVGQEGGTPKEQSVLLQLEAQWSQLMLWLQGHVSYFLLAWFAGFLFYTSRFATGLFYLRHVQQQSSLLPAPWADRVKALQQQLGLHTNVSLVSSAKVNSPFTFGWLRPVIVVPASMLTQLPADQVESILLHELAHIRRHDYLINLLQNIAELFFFFNPGYWYIAQLLEAEREHICDDLVVQHTGNYRMYALALTNLAQLPALAHNRLVMAAAAKENSLLLRIKRIIHTSTSTTMTHHTSSRKSYQVTTLIIACSLFAFLAIDVNGKNVKPTAAENAPVAEAIPEQLTVTGLVLTKEGTPLPGVAISIKNGTAGTATASDGTYRLSAATTDTLVYRFVGFEKKELAATDKATQRVVLSQSTQPAAKGSLKEIEVIGRASDAPTQVKVATGVQVSGQAIPAQAPVSSTISEVRVEGRELNATYITVKGGVPVTGNTAVTTASGVKSDDFMDKLVVRAASTASSDKSKQPLYFIYENDALSGVKFGTPAFEKVAAKGKQITELKDIDPDFIQAIHVLKDQMAIGAFGEAGKNGAVLISLKEDAYKAKATDDAEELVVYPVPSDRFVKMKFHLKKNQQVKIDILDFNGVKVKTFANQVLGNGWHELEWDASNSPAGTYIVILNKETGVVNKRVVLK